MTSCDNHKVHCVILQSSGSSSHSLSHLRLVPPLMVLVI
jgi:hypothetical protein